MKRNLLNQMRNEWRNNIWVIVGMALVSLVIWLFCSALYSSLRYWTLPLGFDENDVYVLEVNEIEDTSPDFNDFGEETPTVNSNDMRSLLARIRNSNHVEYAGFAMNGTPYYLSGYNSALYLVGDEPDTIGFAGNFRFISPDVVKVLRLRSLTGKDEDWLQKKLQNGEIFVSPDPKYDPSMLGKKNERGWPLGFRSAEDMNGKTVFSTKDSTITYHVADVVELVRRTGLERPRWGGAIFPIDESADLDVTHILVRVKPGQGDKFREEYETSPEMQGQRNVYLTNFVSLENQGKATEYSDWVDVRLYIALICFLLLILFLGLLGTFWFRIQQRIGEIAIRRVCGASRWSIFRRVLGEGMILLICATLLAAVVGWIIIKKTNLITGFTTEQYVWFEISTAAIVAVGIILSVIYPAWRAMNIKPALAVKDE